MNSGLQHKFLPYKVFFQNDDDRTLFVENGLIKKSKTDVLPGSGVDLKFFNSTQDFPVKKCLLNGIGVIYNINFKAFKELI